MNKEEYISSGILERYVLGQCTSEESSEVLRMISVYPEIQGELDEIESTLIQYAATNVVVPDRVKNAVMAHVKSGGNGTQTTNVVTMSPPQNKFNWLAAASVVLLLGSAFLNYVQYTRNNSLSGEIASLRDQNSVFANDLDVTKAGYEKSQQLFAFLNDTATKVISMKGVPTSPNSQATIYWNKKTSEVYLSVNSLDKQQSEYDYQLWAIVDGAPVNAGILQMSDTSSIPQKMESFSNAQAFAVTIEKKGGSVSPTLEKMVVIGNAI